MRKLLTDTFTIDFSFYIFAAAFLLLLPLRLAFAWLLAVIVHEMSHYIALVVCRVPVHAVKLRGSGMIIDTAPMTPKQDLICALAGPLGGLTLLFTAHWLPCTAICAFVQSTYNLLPVFPLDGGRALRSVLLRIFGDRQGELLTKSISYTIMVLLSIATFYLTWRYNVGILPYCLVCCLCLKVGDLKFPCKPHKQIVQ